MAALQSPPLQLRTGCFCAPGACQAALRLSDDTVQSQHLRGHTCGDSHDMVDGLPTGAVRASFGWCSAAADAAALGAFLADAFAGTATTTDAALSAAVRAADPTCYGPFPGKGKGKAGRLRLSELWVYPVKSCGGLRAQTWPIAFHATHDAAHDATHDAGGGGTAPLAVAACLALDRAFVVVDAHSGEPLRAKQHPRLLSVTPRVDLAGGTLALAAPAMRPLVVMTGARLVQEPDGPRGERAAFLAVNSGDEGAETVAVCSAKSCGAAEASAEASAWFSELLGVPARLLRVAGPFGGSSDSALPSTSPSSSSSSTSSTSSSSSSSSFSNEGAFLLVSEQSVGLLDAVMQQQLRDQQLRDAEKKGQQRGNCGEGGGGAGGRVTPLVTARNFRPNFVVGGSAPDGLGSPHADAHAEDGWGSLSVGGVAFAATGDCARCAMVDLRPPAQPKQPKKPGGAAASGSGEAPSVASNVARAGVLRSLASYRRRHADILFGRFLTALSPSVDAGIGGPERPKGAAVVELRWVSEGDEVVPSVVPSAVP